jgi:hypothetical protein
MKEWREVRLAKLCHGPHVGAVAIHHENFELGRPPQSLFQQAKKFLQLLAFARTAAEYDLPTIGGKEGTTIGSWTMRQTANVAPIRGHRVNLQIAIAHARENDTTVATDGGLGVVTVGKCETLQI